ncbi:MAG TPA: HDOD domain-containing protein [Azospira sp.]|nr:HDOD domain-containing protein [Azospira sp.]
MTPTLLQLDRVVEAVRQLPSLPAVVMELLESAEREDVNADELAEKIALDQALAAKALKVANSPFYGLQSKVATIQDATVILGLRQVRSLVTAAAVTGAFPASAAGWFNPHLFWQHCVGVALCARTLAPEAGLSPDGAFTAGLLHDIGRLVLVTGFPEEYKQVSVYQKKHDCFLLTAERDVLGLDHATVGRALAERWRFAPSIQEAVAFHHAPEEATATSLAGLVHVADVMAHALDLCPREDELVPPLSSVAWNRLGISWPRFKTLLSKVEDQFDDVCSALNI